MVKRGLKTEKNKKKIMTIIIFNNNNNNNNNNNSNNNNDNNNPNLLLIKLTIKSYLQLISLIIQSKYFRDSDWLKAHA